MSRKSLPPLSQECEELREQLENWRKTRQKRTRVPEAIWKSAVRLAEKFGTNRIASTMCTSRCNPWPSPCWARWVSPSPPSLATTNNWISSRKLIRACGV